MADENRGTPILKTNFLLFCLYVMFYITLRGNGEIVYQEAAFRSGGSIDRITIVGSEQTIPRWRRQAYRVFFSPLMVVEEEGRRLFAESRNLMDVGFAGSR
jgi:hypothetical protein